MADQSTEQLTENQRACLRLVLTHHSSKEIAAKLGISPSAVDKRIERAVVILGATSRFGAARALHEREGGTWERTTSEAIDIPPPPDPPPSTGQDKPWGLARRFLGVEPGSGSSERARNRLGRFNRLAAVIILIAVLALSSAALLDVAATLARFFRHAGIVPPHG